MIFEYDQNKSVANEAKLGPTLDCWRLKESQEMRCGDKFWTAVWTRRGEDSEITRIISVRRARKKEIKSYEENDHS